MTKFQQGTVAAALLIAGVTWGSVVTFLVVRETRSGPPPRVMTSSIFVSSKSAFVSSKSSIDKLEQRVTENFKGVKYHEPDVVWQAKDGTTESEEYIFKMYGISSLKQQKKARALLKKDGWRRVYERCGGITRPDNRWSFGICTYRDAPVVSGPGA